MTLKQVTEALVFASPKPISTKELVAALRSAAEGSDDVEVQDFAKANDIDVAGALAELQADLIASGRAFQLVERVNGWALVSDPACAIWVRQLYPEAKPTRLTGPQLETLAIIAYRQPVTRADIEAVRGVSVDGVMQVLLDRGLVKIAGRAEVPGRPLLYSTSEYFLEHFGLKNTDELPNSSELKRVPLPVAVAKTEDSGQKTEDSGQKTEDSGQKTEDGGQKTEDGGQIPAEPPADPDLAPAETSEPVASDPQPEPAPTDL